MTGEKRKRAYERKRVFGAVGGIRTLVPLFDDNTISSRARYDLFDTTAYSLFAVNSKIYYTKFLALVNTYFPKSERIYEQDVPENTLPINFF